MSLSRHDLGVWMINLPRASERRQRMQAQLSALQLDCILFDGVDGRACIDALRPKVDVSAFERNVGRKLLWGEIGCYASHLGVWDAFLASGKQVALILEDDVVFHDDFLTALDLALAHADQWDFLKLNKIRAKLPVVQGQIGPYRLNAYIGPATGLGAYLITRDTVQRLRSAMLPMTRPIDIELNRFFAHYFRLLGLEPFPSHVDDGGKSQITGDGFGAVKKYKLYRRLPYYALKASNYLRRLLWLARHKMLWRSEAPPQNPEKM